MYNFIMTLQAMIKEDDMNTWFLIALWQQVLWIPYYRYDCHCNSAQYDTGFEFETL